MDEIRKCSAIPGALAWIYVFRSRFCSRSIQLQWNFTIPHKKKKKNDQHKMKNALQRLTIHWTQLNIINFVYIVCNTFCCCWNDCFSNLMQNIEDEKNPLYWKYVPHTIFISKNIEKCNWTVWIKILDPSRDTSHVFDVSNHWTRLQYSSTLCANE